ELEERNRRWQAPDVNCGLPLREIGRLQPVETVAASPGGSQLLAGSPRGSQLLAGGRAGVYRSSDRGASYRNCSGHEFETEVLLPPNWLFCSEEHTIEVIAEDATG
ncbi:MAG: hypothetical protein WBM40_11970, partial [Thiohalocapsa sp.]